MPKARIEVGERAPFVKKILLVEGISRSGKFLMADLLNGFNGVEAVQYYGLLEHIPFLEKFNLMDHKTAQELLRCEIDTHAYEMAIGRNFNHRRSDKSSIYKNVNAKKFLERPSEDDISVLLRDYIKTDPYSFFVAHELLPNAKIYFETFPNLKMVSLLRSPIELVDSWYRRGLAKRFAGDPSIFIVPFKKGKILHPWYVTGHEKEYASLSEMDRTIFMIEQIVKLYDEALKKLSKKERAQILFVRYEDILLNTKTVVGQLAKFLGKKPHKDMVKILKRENLPNREYNGMREEKLKTISALASPEFFKRLRKLETKYQSKIA